MAQAKSDPTLLKQNPTRVRLPAWTFGGNPAGIRDLVGWEVNPTPEAGIWSVRNRESVHGRAPRLLRLHHLGAAANPGVSEGFKVLLGMGRHDDLSDPAFWPTATARHESLVEDHGNELTAMLESVRTLLIAAPRADMLPDLVRNMLGEWFRGPLPNATAHLIETNDHLSARYGLVRMLLQGDATPTPSNSGMHFESSFHLLEDINLGLWSYLEPLFASRAPAVWGMTAARAGGVVVLNFGQLVPGRADPRTDPIALSRGLRVGTGTLGPTDLSVSAFRSALGWWVRQLDLVFSHLTEPANYAVDGYFDPALALERLLNFQQVCRTCLAIATSEDDFTSRILLFNVLDSLEGISAAWDWKFLTSVSRAERTLAELRDHIPADAHSVLLPRAEHAVSALQHVQHGFNHPSYTRGEFVLLPDRNGVSVEVPRASAASWWLRTIRNGQHGYSKPTQRDRALLAAHNGKTLAGLADLAWLYLLKLMAEPHLARRGKPGVR